LESFLQTKKRCARRSGDPSTPPSMRLYFGLAVAVIETRVIEAGSNDRFR
jgi:hypothetical protein